MYARMDACMHILGLSRGQRHAEGAKGPEAVDKSSSHPVHANKRNFNRLTQNETTEVQLQLQRKMCRRAIFSSAWYDRMHRAMRARGKNRLQITFGVCTPGVRLLLQRLPFVAGLSPVFPSQLSQQPKTNEDQGDKKANNQYINGDSRGVTATRKRKTAA